MEQYLPTEEEQEWLLASLRSLIASCGWERFVASHLLLPTRTYLPDEVGDDRAAGVHTLCRRLLNWVGLGELGVKIEFFSPHDVDDDSVAAVYRGSKQGVCSFAINTDQLDDAQALLGTLSHEVAHAWRDHHGLATESDDDDELLTDITSVYLCLGIFTSNVSYRYLKSGWVAGPVAVTSWQTSAGGYLPPQAMSFLLAAQAVVRGPVRKEMRRIARHLEPNQRAYFEAAFKQLKRDTDGLRANLGIPNPALFPEPPDLDTLTRTLDPPAEAPAESSEHRIGRPINTGRPVFRVLGTQAFRFRLGLGIVGFIAGILAESNYGWTMAFLYMPLIGVVAGHLIGSRRPENRCSDCDTDLEDDMNACPGCRGRIIANINNRKERLAGLEALEEQKQEFKDRKRGGISRCVR